MGVTITGIGRGLPGDNVPGSIVTNEKLARQLLAVRSKLASKTEAYLRKAKHRHRALSRLQKPNSRLILPPEMWPVDTDQRKKHEKRWEQFEMDPAWILQRTGIEERRFADPGIATSDLAIAAVRDCCANAGCDPSTIDGLILGTVSPDYPQTPPTSAIIQHAVGIPTISLDGSFRRYVTSDVTLACSSFMAALQLGWSTITSGLAHRLIVVGADRMVGTFDPNHRSLLGILADGAGALLLEHCANGDDAFRFGSDSFLSGVDGSYADLIMTPQGGSFHPLGVGDITSIWDTDRYMGMDGSKVLAVAIKTVVKLIEESLCRAGITIGDVDFLGLHQANPRRINASVEEKLRKKGFRGRCPHPGTHFGNMTSGSIPVLLWESWRDGILQPGMLVNLVAFGGGFSWWSGFFRWPTLSPR